MRVVMVCGLWLPKSQRAIVDKACSLPVMDRALGGFVPASAALVCQLRLRVAQTVQISQAGWTKASPLGLAKTV
jgi:hypothetical protein